MLRLKDNTTKLKIHNYADFTGWNLKLSEVIDYIKNLTLDDIKIDEFNSFDFKKYGETVIVYIYKDGYERINMNINEIF